MTKHSRVLTASLIAASMMAVACAGVPVQEPTETPRAPVDTTAALVEAAKAFQATVGPAIELVTTPMCGEMMPCPGAVSDPLLEQYAAEAGLRRVGHTDPPALCEWPVAPAREQPRGTRLHVGPGRQQPGGNLIVHVEENCIRDDGLGYFQRIAYEMAVIDGSWRVVRTVSRIISELEAVASKR